MYIPSIVLITSLLAQLTCADWQFRSRPDLSVPRWNITVSTNREALEKGYIFIAPYNGFVDGARGPEQEGAYIFRDDGDLVWSSVGTFGGWITNFQASFWQGEPILRAFEGLLDAAHGRMYGKHTILNNRYEVIKTVKPASHRLVSCHEFRVLESGTVLVETPVAVPTNLSAWGGDHAQNWIVSGGFQGKNSPSVVQEVPNGMQRLTSTRGSWYSNGIVWTMWIRNVGGIQGKGICLDFHCGRLTHHTHQIRHFLSDATGHSMVGPRETLGTTFTSTVSTKTTRATI